MMVPQWLSRLWKKKAKKAESGKQDEPSKEAAPYTEEEAEKVRKRLQGLGYIG